MSTTEFQDAQTSDSCFHTRAQQERASALCARRRAPMALGSMIPSIGGGSAESCHETPVSKAVQEGFQKQPHLQQKSHVHKVSLRSFREDPSLTGGLAEGRRCASAACLSSLDDVSSRPSTGAGRSNSKGSSNLFSRPGTSHSLRAGRCDATLFDDSAAKSDFFRSLTSAELAQNQHKAVDWFRVSRAINSNSRHLEVPGVEAFPTETLANGSSNVKMIKFTSPGSRSVSKQSTDVGSDTESQASEEQPKSAPRRLVDAAALWGLKPLKKSAPKPACAFIPRSISKEGVAVGQGGENSLLARLARQKSTPCL